MAEIIADRGRTQSRGDYITSGIAGGASMSQGNVKASGGSLRRPSRLLLSVASPAGSGQEHVAHTLPPLSPSSNPAGHSMHRTSSGTSGNRGLVTGASGAAAVRQEGRNAGASGVSATSRTQHRNHIVPGGSSGGMGNAGGSSGGPMGNGFLSMRGMGGQRAKASTMDRSHGSVVSAGNDNAAPTTVSVAAPSSSTAKGNTTGRPSMRLPRDSTLVSGAARQQGGRARGPVAGPGSAAARAAEARAAATATMTAIASNGDNSGDDDSGDALSARPRDNGIAAERTSGLARIPASQTHQYLRGGHAGFEGGSAAAGLTNVVGSSGGDGGVGRSPSASPNVSLRGLTSSTLPLNSASSSLTALRTRSPGIPATPPATATWQHAPRPLSGRVDDASSQSPPSQSSLPQPSPPCDPLGLGIGPLSMFGPLAMASQHTPSYSSVIPRPASSASSRPANTIMPAAGSTSESRSGRGSDHEAMSMVQPQLMPAVAQTTGSGMLESDAVVISRAGGAAVPAGRPNSSSGSDVATERPSGRPAAGLASRMNSQESDARPVTSTTPGATQREILNSSLPGASGVALSGQSHRMHATASRVAARAGGRGAAPLAAATTAAGGTGFPGGSNTRNGAAARGSGALTTSVTPHMQSAAGNRPRTGASSSAASMDEAVPSSTSVTSSRTTQHRVPTWREENELRIPSTGAGRQSRGEADGDSGPAGPAAIASFNPPLGLLDTRDPATLGNAGRGGNGGGAAAHGAMAARRRSSHGPSEAGRSSGGGGPSLRGAVRHLGLGLDLDVGPLGARAGSSSRVVAVSRAAAGATRLLYDSGNPHGSEDDSYGDGDSDGSSVAGGTGRQAGHVRMPQRLFRVQVNPQAADATTFGPARPLGSSRPPLPAGHQHQTSQQSQQSRPRRRTSDDNDGIIGGTLVIGGGGGGFQERFLADLRRRDAQRAALMQLLMIGGEEELLRQAEEEQLALALMLSLQEAAGGASGGSGGAMAVATGPRMVTVRVVAAEPAMTYEDLLTLEDVKVTTPQEVLDSLPHFPYTGVGSAPDGTCAICQCDYEVYEQLVRLPCLHVLHASCARKWLGEYSKKCPVCKQEVC